MRKKVLLLLILSIAFISFGCVDNNSNNKNNTSTAYASPFDNNTFLVDIANITQQNTTSVAFIPDTLTIRVNNTVVWTNRINKVQDVVGNDSSSQPLGLGYTYTHTFDKAGIYEYHSSFSLNTTGKVIVY